MFSMEMKNLKGLEDFKNKIRKWEPDGYDCKLCKDFISDLGYVNLVWLWNISLTVSISKFGLISSARKRLLCRHLAARSRHEKTATGCELWTGLAMMTTEWCRWSRPGVCIAGFGSISRPLLLFLLLILREKLATV